MRAKSVNIQTKKFSFSYTRLSGEKNILPCFLVFKALLLVWSLTRIHPQNKDKFCTIFFSYLKVILRHDVDSIPVYVNVLLSARLPQCTPMPEAAACFLPPSHNTTPPKELYTLSLRNQVISNLITVCPDVWEKIGGRRGGLHISKVQMCPTVELVGLSNFKIDRLAYYSLR